MRGKTRWMPTPAEGLTRDAVPGICVQARAGVRVPWRWWVGGRARRRCTWCSAGWPCGRAPRSALAAEHRPWTPTQAVRRPRGACRPPHAARCTRLHHGEAMLHLDGGAPTRAPPRCGRAPRRPRAGARHGVGARTPNTETTAARTAHPGQTPLATVGRAAVYLPSRPAHTTTGDNRCRAWLPADTKKNIQQKKSAAPRAHSHAVRPTRPSGRVPSLQAAAHRRRR